jgi:anti-anti-sigma factor
VTVHRDDSEQPAGVASRRPPLRGKPAGASGPFSVAISRALGMVVVTVHGGLDADGSERLRHLLWELIDQQGNQPVVLDLRDMAVADGADVAVFVEASHCARQHGGRLVVSGSSSLTAQALARAGLTEALDIEPCDPTTGLQPTAARAG